MKKKCLIISLIVFLIDLFSKIIIDNILELNETINIINNFFRITKVYNIGASFSILMGYNILFIIFAIIVLCVIYKSVDQFKVNNRNIMAFGLLTGGIIGNLFDRVFYKHVIDFLDFKIFNYNAPIFNIADTAICFGVLLLIIAIGKREDKYGNKS